MDYTASLWTNWEFLLKTVCPARRISSAVLTYPASERCVELMTEDPERETRRRFLMKEKAKATKAQEWLASAKKDDVGDPDDLFVPE